MTDDRDLERDLRNAIGELREIVTDLKARLRVLEAIAYGGVGMILVAFAGFVISLVFKRP